MLASFLGNSATFLGCISTLVVLCFLFDNSNFIYKLITSIIEESIQEVKKNIEEHDQKLKEADKNVKDILRKFSKKSSKVVSNDDLKMLNIGQLFDMLHQSAVFRQRSLQNIIDMLKKGDEFISSFWYTFLFCLLVFIFDELADEWMSKVDIFSMNLVLSFSLISIFLWILQWIYFVNKIDKRKLDLAVKYHFGLIKSIFLTVIIPVILLSIAYCLEIYTNIKFTPLSLFLFFWGMSALVGLIAFMLFWNNEYRFTSYFVISHFFCLLIAFSIMFGGAHLIIEMKVIIDPVWIRRISLFTALLTGIILPFIIPLLKLMHCIRGVKKENEEDANLLRAKDPEILKSQNEYMLKSKNTEME